MIKQGAASCVSLACVVETWLSLLLSSFGSSNSKKNLANVNSQFSCSCDYDGDNDPTDIDDDDDSAGRWLFARTRLLKR